MLLCNELRLFRASAPSPPSASSAGKVGVIHSLRVCNLASALTLWLTLKKMSSPRRQEVAEWDASCPRAIAPTKERERMRARGCRAGWKHNRSQPTLIAPDKERKNDPDFLLAGQKIWEMRVGASLSDIVVISWHHHQNIQYQTGLSLFCS